ncbi:unnamed protein product, partial [marine sediment metagenome]
MNKTNRSMFKYLKYKRYFERKHAEGLGVCDHV